MDGTIGGVRFEEDNARDLFDAKVITQRDGDEGHAKEPQGRGRGDVGKARRDLRAMKEWAEAQPPAFREGAMNIYRAQAAACKAPKNLRDSDGTRVKGIIGRFGRGNKFAPKEVRRTLI